MIIKDVNTGEDILQTWEVMHLLRPHLKKDAYVELVEEMMKDGYRMAYAEENGIAVSVIGFRHLQFLFNGKHIYIDDLSTLPDQRGKGYASKLLDYIIDIAKENGYKSVTLDSGTHRFVAHKLYFNKGFTIEGYHFFKPL